MSDEKTSDNAVRRRKLAYRASHRGMKEMDLVLGGYVARHIDQMTGDELDILEDIIILQDVDLLNWVTGKEPVPDQHKSDLLDAVLAFSISVDDYTRL